jgi:glycosyltransferase involved in cell wall biosynthesis
MNLLYCHDGPTEVDSLGNAYPQTFTEEVLSRYYTIADNITMLMRTRVIDPKNTKNPMANMEKLRIVKSPNLASVKGKLFGTLEAKRILRMEMEKADYVIARLPSNIGNLAVDMARKLNKTYLIELVACPWDAYWNHSFKGKLVAPFMYMDTKKRVKEADNVVYVTNEFLQRRYPTKGKNTNCSNVALTEFDETILKRRLEKINSLNKSDKIIIGTTAAVDVRYKGQQYVIQALGKLKEQGYTNYEYQLVGAGEQSYLRSIAKKYDVIDQITFMGPMPHNEVFKWLETIDIYAQPSRQEGLPRALIEAMSRGLPAIGARTAGIPELLEDNVIFSNTKNNIDEICLVLNLFSKEQMTSQAKRNFEESKKYDKETIEKRRQNFFWEFKELGLLP